MKKLILPILLLLLFPPVGQAQNPVRYHFFAGDTLDGFDLTRAYTDMLSYAQNHHLTNREQTNYMYARERTFVRTKYPIATPQHPGMARTQLHTDPSLLATCNNLDFETGDYSGWTGAYGYNSNSGSPLMVQSPTISSLGVNAPEGSCSYHTIVTGAIGNDPYGAFPQLDPGGGRFAQRLGGEAINQYGGSDFTGTYSCSGGAYDGINLCSGGEYLEQTFPVTSANAMFSYAYAVVLHDGGHTTGEQPYFRVEVLDQFGNPLPCLQYYQECNNGTPPPGYSSSVLNSSVFYIGWQHNTLNLKPYLGTNVTVRFTAAGCIFGGHFGYAYIDATCGPLQLIATTPPSCPPAAPSATFMAPNGGLTYSWAKVPPGAGIVGSSTGQSVSINQNGTYEVTVTTGGGCSYTMDTTISFPVSPGLSMTSANVSCNGGSNGTATVTATLGTTPYTYAWAPSGGTAATAGVLVAGSYTVTVTTASGCSASTPVTITQPAALTSTNTHTNVSCNGGNNGAATVSPSGGIPGYSYLWAPSGGTGATASTLTAGIYTCAITDSKGCTTASVVTLTQPAALSSTSSQSNVSCNGGTSGSASVALFGGTPAYSYAWTPSGGTGAAASGLSAGTYTCTATDSKGCSLPTLFTITQPPILVSTPVPVNVSCNGGTNGAASITASGGTAAYTYSWTPVAGNSNSVTGLSAGNYTCTLTDSKGCTTSSVIGITQPPLLTASSTQTNVSCNGGTNGSATLSVSGGTAAYTYAWAPSGGTASVASGLGTGTYICTITDNHGCITLSSVNITQPAAIALTSSSITATCGASNGSASVIASGGTPGYSYAWSPAGGNAATAPLLSSGSYTCLVTDAHHCNSSVTVIVSNQNGPSLTPGPIHNVTCFGACNGSVNVTASGGTGALTYSWGPVAGTTNSLSALCPGSYTCTVTDTNNCPASLTATITEPPALVSSIINSTDVSCFGGNNGAATVHATGGSAPITYAWTPTGGTGTTASGLIAGLYSVTVTDRNGCSQKDTITITQPPALGLTAAGVATSCHGSCDGVLICIPSGGSSPYTYSWNTGCSLPSCNGVCAGSYSVTVTDNHGCAISGTTTVTQPSAIVLTLFSVAAHCFHPDGTDSVSASGGTGPYTYAWSVSGSVTTADHHVPPGLDVVTVHDAHGCPAKDSLAVGNIPGAVAKIISSQNVSCFGGNNGSATAGGTGGVAPYSYHWATGAATATATGLAAGTYLVTLTDARGCTGVDSATILQPTAVAANPMAALTLCIGQCMPLTASASGGTPGYTYTWTLNSVTAVSPACPVITTTYTVIATDANGCVSPPALVTIPVNPPLQVAAGNDASICPGRSTTLHATASGGDGSYAYSWSTAIGLSSTTISNPIANPAATTIYTVVITDGCGTPPAHTTDTVTIYPTPVVVFSANDTAGCVQLCVNFTALSSPACSSATWIFGDGSTASGCTNINHCYLTPGLFTITEQVTDIHGCAGSLTRTNYINAWPTPEAAFTLGPQPATIVMSDITFTDQSHGAISWNWNFGTFSEARSSVQNPHYTYPDTGCYVSSLIVQNTYGCKDTAYGPLCIHPDFSFYVPNAFTPNGDGKNDTWEPKGLGVDPNTYHMVMYDRWGNQIWETRTWDLGWDGRANGGDEVAQIDTYVWKCTVSDFLGNQHLFEGHCSIIK